ncbi:hypothetical protein [Jiella avicenniae]|uniref:Uncharacterized protein n=1 Tax=Jiella avicenniae TaxID=2907202 RepID=A0A9X1T2N4_9HYPH|nr:hypothetical protein [Jiella avicenniae]MCE7026441.1 hypothetical protein [Jiella avicenniae]
MTSIVLGEASVATINSIIGHIAGSAKQIPKHDLARHPEMADTLIGKMVAWFEKGDENAL